MHFIPISINKVETRKIVLSKKDLYGKKGSFKFLLDIYMTVMPFRYHYV